MRFDLLVFGPLLVGLACFAPRAWPEGAASTVGRARSVALPPIRKMPVRGASTRRAARHYQLDLDRSTVRFLVEGERLRLLAKCTRVEGDLSLGDPADADGGEMLLAFDLASLQLLHADPAGTRARDVLGVLGDVQLRLRLRRISVASSDLAGVQRDRWLGTAHLGERVLLQPVDLWRCELPGRRLRCQGHGTVLADLFGLADPPWFGVGDGPITVTMGMDLAWRRQRDD